MSENNQSNLQAFGAGVAGFFVVVAVGGGALALHSRSQQHRGPVAAAAPVDIGAPSLSRPAPRGLPAREARSESPAPLIGDVGGDEEQTQAPAQQAAAAPNAPAAGAALAATAAAPARPLTAAAAGKAGSDLKVSQHLTAEGGSTSAEIAAKDSSEPKKDETPAKKAAKAAPRKALEPAAGAPEIASVHYGVTNRSELMGRAAGPVYNFSGAASKNAQVGKLSGTPSMADLKAQLAKQDLPDGERAKIQAQIDLIEKAVTTQTAER